MVSVDQAYMVGHMKNADGSINNKNVVLSAACEAAELFLIVLQLILYWTLTISLKLTPMTGF
ncbi:hypothetical protein [Blautia wexlerae]|uniref:hypothetical protein n=1 Tax=Blautia wexlerae TaxID=418240 RepID=UPI0035BEAC7C